MTSASPKQERQHGDRPLAWQRRRVAGAMDAVVAAKDACAAQGLL